MAVISPEFIVEAYIQGYFPMGKEGSDEDVEWYTATRRGIIPIHTFHIPKRVLRTIRSNHYTLGINRDFAGVIDGCANRDSTWINNTIRDTFKRLHEVGIAHSIEVRKNDELFGGLYGIALGGAFFAESVFQNKPECMKIALHFCHITLVAKGFKLWDVQFQNPFLKQFGCIEVSPSRYSKLLNEALTIEPELLSKSDSQG
jgi:leucyl/phenylalanyl-tRNA--protein transferase